LSSPTDAPLDTGAFAAPGDGREEACHLPQISHLSVAQLRQRAAEDRDDALRMSGRGFTGCVTMLMADAERCEAQADELEAAVARSGLNGPTIESAIDLLTEAARGRAFDWHGRGDPDCPPGQRLITTIQANIARNLDGTSLYGFTALAADNANKALQPRRLPTLTAAVEIALLNLRALARV